MAVLLLRLAAPLQAWGSNSKFGVRATEREPTKSGVIGMLAAALGLQRNDEKTSEVLEQLSAMRFGVRTDREGRLIRDFHTVKFDKNADISDRYYLSDAAFVAAFESEDTELLNRLAEAVLQPYYPMFLGRRSCPPTLPVFLEISSDDLVTALKNAEPAAEKTDSVRRLVYDSDKSGMLVQDVPVSFSQLHRQHGYRRKTEEFLYSSEHDPMSEL